MYRFILENEWCCTTWNCLPRLLPSQFCTCSHGSICASNCVPFLLGVFWTCGISHSYCFLIADWRKDIFFHLGLYIKTIVDISTCPTGLSFLCSSDTQRARSTLCTLKISQRQSDLQNALIHMLRPCVRSLEGEASGKGLSKDPKHRVHSSWPMNQKELI